MIALVLFNLRIRYLFPTVCKHQWRRRVVRMSVAAIDPEQRGVLLAAFETAAAELLASIVPEQIVTMRMLDPDGREVHSKVKGDTQS